MNTEPIQHKSYLTEYIVIFGYLTFLCLALSVCSVFYYFTFLQAKPSPVNTFATSLPPTTPTPHILPTNQQRMINILEEDFNDDHMGWADNDEDASRGVRLGKFRLESKAE